MQLTDSQLQELHTLTDGTLYDADSGDLMLRLDTVYTRDTLVDFEQNSAKWRERSVPIRGNLGPYPYIVWNKTQAKLFQGRTPFSVIDRGEFRIAFKEHIKKYMPGTRNKGIRNWSERI